MSSKRYGEEFKIEAVKQITERHYSVAGVSARLGVSQHSLYKWVKKYSQAEPARCETQRQQAELRELKAELKRNRGTRHPKKGRGVLCQGIPVRCAFIKTHEAQHSVRGMCRMMEVHPSGYDAWRATPVSTRQR